MLTKEFEINNPIGLHARAAAVFVQTCSFFTSEIMITKEKNAVNAKSIIGVLALGVNQGETISIQIDGDDEAEAMEEIEHFFAEKIQKY